MLESAKMQHIMTDSYRSTRRNARRKSQPFLPEGMKSFIAGRMVDTIALALVFAAVFLAAILLSHNAADPSWNTIVTGKNTVFENVGGAYGAWFSDFVLQYVGWAAFLLPLLILAWGLRLWRRAVIAPVVRRFAAFVLAVFFTAVFLAGLKLPEHLLSDGLYAGGVVGELSRLYIGKAMQPVIGAFYGQFLSLLCFVFAIGLLFYALSLPLRAYRYGALTFISFLALCYDLLAHLWRRFYGWVRHYDALDFERQDEKPAFSLVTWFKGKIADWGSDDEGDEVDARSHERSHADKIEPRMEKPQPRVAPMVPEAAQKPKLAVVKRDPETLPVRKNGEDNRQKSLVLSTNGEEWELPPLDILQEPDPSKINDFSEADLQKTADNLQLVLQDFGIKGDIVKVHPGPVVTLFELEPAPGTKSSRVIGLADDIARSMKAISVRAAVIPGKNAIGLELPNPKRETVYLRELLAGKDYTASKLRLPLVLGKDIGGHSVIADLARMPHLLVAGTTGSGKSVAVNTMILSLLYTHSPDQCRFIMIDPKMLELSIYNDIPHLLSPVVTDPAKAIVALKWAVREMEDRYRAMSKLGVRNIDGYNERLRQAREKGEVLTRRVQTGFDAETGKPVFEDQPIDLTELPYIVVVVDEFADLMMVAGKDVENAIQRLAQMARAAGIHLIMATQRPSVDVITGTIKANFPTRISFQVTSKIDSRTILGDGGAEQLLGQGDMLYMAAGGRIQRVHGPFASDGEVENIVNFLKDQGAPDYVTDVTEGGDDDGDMGALGGGGSDVDELYDQAVAIVARERKASTSFIQRHLQIGYNRAARIIEQMEREGVIGQANHVGKREILLRDERDDY